MLLQILLQEWEWKNKAIPRTPTALKKKVVKKGFTQVYTTVCLLKARSPKAFSKKSKEKEREKVLCSTHRSTHFYFILTPIRVFHSLCKREWKEVCKISKSYVCTGYNNKLISLHHWETCLNVILLTKLAASYKQLHVWTLGALKICKTYLSTFSCIHSCNVARKLKAMIIALTL